jgi:hypothetical protein
VNLFGRRRKKWGRKKATGRSFCGMRSTILAGAENIQLLLESGSHLVHLLRKITGFISRKKIDFRQV